MYVVRHHFVFFRLCSQYQIIACLDDLGAVLCLINRFFEYRHIQKFLFDVIYLRYNLDVRANQIEFRWWFIWTSKLLYTSENNQASYWTQIFIFRVKYTWIQTSHEIIHLGLIDVEERPPVYPSAKIVPPRADSTCHQQRAYRRSLQRNVYVMYTRATTQCTHHNISDVIKGQLGLFLSTENFIKLCG